MEVRGFPNNAADRDDTGDHEDQGDLNSSAALMRNGV
jgi:hypothetical protein